MRTADFDYELPPERIAQHPRPRRDQSRLLVLERATGRLWHRRFSDLVRYLNAGDLLVLNNSRVLPARLRGQNARTGGRFELLLLEETRVNEWWVMLRPGRRARPGTDIRILPARGAAPPIQARVLARNAEGHFHVRFEGVADLKAVLEQVGEMPLPPYIERANGRYDAADRERYQTVYAQVPGSVAAPTAGLHFTPELLKQLRTAGVHVGYLTLHVGPGTFLPVRTEAVEAHTMHAEWFELPPQTVRLVETARAAGRRVVAVGTTTLRVLESVAAQHDGRLVPGPGRTRLFVYPPYRFLVVDALVTNFHLPRSTLLMLVSAFAAPGETGGRERILAAYAEAIRRRYRFYSYGDAMLVL